MENLLEQKIDKIIVKLVEMDEYMKTNFVTKDEHKRDIDRLTTHIDGFVKLHETLDVELLALRSKVTRLEDRLARVEARLQMAA